MTLLDARGNASAPVTTAHIIIGVPAQDTLQSSFAFDLAQMMQHTSLARPDLAVRLVLHKGTYLIDQRHQLVRIALDAKATHLLWIDSDMRFPADTLIRLLEHNTPVVAVNYPRRRFPQLPTASTGQGFVFCPKGAEGLEEVESVGMGVMLTEMGIFSKIPAPWFSLGYSPKRDEFVGEDVTFCGLVREHGMRVMLDCGLSQEIGHLGEMEFRNEHALAVREALMADEANNNGA